MWVWGSTRVEVNNPDETFIWGKTIDDYFAHISQANSLRYFFNLKFDGGFIVSRLLQLGYVHVETDRDGLAINQFTTLMSNMGKLYSIKVKWSNGRITEFNDAAKKFAAGMSVSSLPEVFGLEISKGDIDYHSERPVGYEPTLEELDYLKRDTGIVARAVAQVRNSGMKRLTIGSDSLADYKATLGGEKRFRRIFPILSDEMDAEIRRAYRGGFTYSDPRFRGRQVGGGIVLDVNSLYPSVMYNGVIPYGEPEYVDGEVLPSNTRPCTIFSVTFTATLKKDHIPCIQIKNSGMFAPTDYLTDIPEPVTLMVTNIDWALWNDHYNITVISYNGGWRFLGAKGLFKDYIDKWSEIKATSTGGMREIAKLHLNSLYGKLCSNPNVTGKYPELNEDEIVVYKRGMDSRRSPVYTAAGVFITSLARDLTIRAAQQSYDVFAYADTDSLHLMTDKIPSGIDVHPTRMGAWKHEYDFEAAYFVRAKAYLERKRDGKYKVAWAGLPSKIAGKMTFDDLMDGKIMHGKLVPRMVRNGVVLTDTPYKLNLQSV